MPRNSGRRKKTRTHDKGEEKVDDDSGEMVPKCKSIKSQLWQGLTHFINL